MHLNAISFPVHLLSLSTVYSFSPPFGCTVLAIMGFCTNNALPSASTLPLLSSIWLLTQYFGFFFFSLASSKEFRSSNHARTATTCGVDTGLRYLTVISTVTETLMRASGLNLSAFIRLLLVVLPSMYPSLLLVCSSLPTADEDQDEDEDTRLAPPLSAFVPMNNPIVSSKMVATTPPWATPGYPSSASPRWRSNTNSSTNAGLSTLVDALLLLDFSL